MCSVFLSMCSGFLLHFVSGGNSEEDGPLDTTWSEKMQVCRLVIVGDPFISNDIIMTLSLITAVMIIAFQRWQYWLLRIYDSPLYTRLWQSVLTWQYQYIEVVKAKKCRISKLPLSGLRRMRGWIARQNILRKVETGGGWPPEFWKELAIPPPTPLPAAATPCKGPVLPSGPWLLYWYNTVPPFLLYVGMMISILILVYWSSFCNPTLREI